MSIFLFVILTIIIKYIAEALYLKRIVIFIIALPIFYIFISPIYEYVIINLFNSSINNDELKNR